MLACDPCQGVQDDLNWAGRAQTEAAGAARVQHLVLYRVQHLREMCRQEHAFSQQVWTMPVFLQESGTAVLCRGRCDWLCRQGAIFWCCSCTTHPEVPPAELQARKCSPAMREQPSAAPFNGPP